MPNIVRLRAVESTTDKEHARVQFRRTDGAMVQGRFVGWLNRGFFADPPTRPGEASDTGHFQYELMADGEDVEITSANRTDYVRAVRRGELELVAGEF